MMAQGRQLLDKFNLGLVLFLQTPVDPTDVVVLAVGIVVALLRPCEFVARRPSWGFPARAAASPAYFASGGVSDG